MTTAARGAVALALLAAAGDSALVALTITDWSAASAHAVLFGFLVGPPLFLALAAWRRRTHPPRSRLLSGVALAVAVGGLLVLGIDLYRFHTDAAFRRTPSNRRVLVPVVQWLAILAVWLWLVIQEGREKRAARNSQQPP